MRISDKIQREKKVNTKVSWYTKTTNYTQTKNTRPLERNIKFLTQGYWIRHGKGVSGERRNGDLRPVRIGRGKDVTPRE